MYNLSLNSAKYIILYFILKRTNGRVGNKTNIEWYKTTSVFLLFVSLTYSPVYVYDHQ